MPAPVDLAAVLARIEHPWQPHTVAVLNDYDLRVVRTPRRVHPAQSSETDEVFLVLSGSLTIRMTDGDVTLGPGQLYVVPKGTPHQPFAPDGAEVLMVEPSATVNTGDTASDLTAVRRVV